YKLDGQFDPGGPCYQNEHRLENGNFLSKQFRDYNASPGVKRKKLPLDEYVVEIKIQRSLPDKNSKQNLVHNSKHQEDSFTPVTMEHPWTTMDMMTIINLDLNLQIHFPISRLNTIKNSIYVIIRITINHLALTELN
ncbi:6002_t:CDS:2, partial [Racocetra fulgida]